MDTVFLYRVTPGSFREPNGWRRPLRTGRTPALEFASTSTTWWGWRGRADPWLPPAARARRRRE